MTEAKSLPTVVDALEDKAREHKQAENTQYHVSVAQHNIREVNSAIAELEGALKDLRYYETILEEAFDGGSPTMLNSAVQTAEQAVSVTQDELLGNVQSKEMDDGDVDLSGDAADLTVELTPDVETQISQIRSAKKQVESVTQTVQSQLESKRDDWVTKVNAAEELQKILGGQSSDFATTLNHMQRLLNRELMDSSGRASKFVSEWDNATSNWDKHQSLQSFDDFQDRHDISDSTIEDVKTLSKSQRLTLADVSLDSLEEMKRISELCSAVELSL